MRRALSLLWAVTAAWALSACTADPHGLTWGFATPDSRAVVIYAAIAEGSCDGPIRYETLIDVSSRTATDEPMVELGPGHYCLLGRARDIDCHWFLSGTLEVDLPTEVSPHIVDLDTPEDEPACSMDVCVAGLCDGETLDGGMDGSMMDGMADGTADGAPDSTVDSARDSTVDSAADTRPVDTGPMDTCPTPGCVDMTVDPDNCGSLGNTCRDDQWCRMSMCECRPGLTDVSGTCRNLSNDPMNCGSIGNDCSTMGSMVTCRNTCEDSCNAGQTNCSNSCVVLGGNDIFHCGMCGRACSRDRICSGGTCERYFVATTCSSCPCSACGAAGFDSCTTYGGAIICYGE